MKILIKYHLRLGDIIRMFPAARHLAFQGHRVFIECLPAYHSIFQSISYATPLAPEHDEKMDYVIDAQIWKNDSTERYDEYRKSGQKWMDFVYSHPLLEKANRKIVFDVDKFHRHSQNYEYDLISPYGYSQMPKIEPQQVIKLGLKLYGTGNLMILRPQEENILDLPSVSVSNLSYLVSLIKNARNFLTTNSSPSIIGGAVREKYDHIYEAGRDGQDDNAGENAIVHKF